MAFNQNVKLKIWNARDGLHHAYLLEGDAKSILAELHEFLEIDLRFPIKGNPDFWHGVFGTFSIDDGRALKEMQSRRPIGERKIFIVQADFFTREAQNSLLKVLEDPTPDTHFFIITQNTIALLPTLRSRLFIISPGQSPGAGVASPLAKEFLAASSSKRFILLKDIIEAKDKNAAISFLNFLEEALYNNDGRRTSVKNMFVFEEIGRARAYLNDRAPSVKMLLEHIALIVPRAEVREDSAVSA